MVWTVRLQPVPIFKNLKSLSIVKIRTKFMFHNYVAASACWIHNICVSSMARVLKHFNFWKITEMWKEKLPFSANIIFDFSKNKKYNRAFLIQVKDYFVWMYTIFFGGNLSIMHAQFCNYYFILFFILLNFSTLFHFILFSIHFF